MLSWYRLNVKEDDFVCGSDQIIESIGRGGDGVCTLQHCDVRATGFPPFLFSILLFLCLVFAFSSVALIHAPL